MEANMINSAMADSRQQQFIVVRMWLTFLKIKGNLITYNQSSLITLKGSTINKNEEEKPLKIKGN